MRRSDYNPRLDKMFNEHQNGFSLIELLIAMAILALAMLAAASMQFNSVRNNTRGNMVTQANMLAKAKMEELKNTPNLDDIHEGAENGINGEGQSGGIYDRSWTVENLGASARRITVIVKWTKRSQTRTISISTNTRGNGI
jgi:prepilin-type N-terminal cleavage/methylation domain-containing protein